MILNILCLHKDRHATMEVPPEPGPNVVAGDVDAWVSDHVEVLVTELVPAVEDAPAYEDDAGGLVDGADA